MEFHELLFSRGAFSELQSEKKLALQHPEKEFLNDNILKHIVHSLLVYGSY